MKEEEEKRVFRDWLTWLFGYPVSARMASRLRTYWIRALQNPVTFATTPAEVTPLTTLLDWNQLCLLKPCPVIMDPCAGNLAIAKTLREELPLIAARGCLLNNDVDTSHPTEFHFDCIDPEQWQVVPWDVDAFVCSPPFDLIDCLWPYLVLKAKIFTALHVPGDYISNGPQWRRSFWAHLQQEGRAVEIRGLPRVKGRGTRRCSWIIVFASPEVKEMFWQAQNDCFTLFT
jgi:hypothetical protein